MQDADSSGDTQPDETANNDDKTDTSPENDDSDTSDSDTSDTDIPISDDDSDTTSDSTDPQSDEDAADSTDDPYTGTNDDDHEAIIPDIPVVFGNICSGQTKCYDETTEITCPAEGEPFFGQDAQYAKAGKCIPQKFTVKGTGDEKIVFDENLKLEWQQKIPEGSFDWQSAANYCGQEYAGSYDWRLPNKNELASLANYGRYKPASDFPDMPNWTFRTSTSDAKNGKSAWYVIFSESIVNPYAKTNSDSVRCVRRGE